MGEQAVTGAGTNEGATTAGMIADGGPAGPADVSGAGMSADAGATDAAASPPTGAPAGGGAQNRTADVVPGPGGVMTDEAGVVTGELTLRTEYADGQVVLRVQYREADEWYVVTGGTAPLADPAGLDAVHTIAVGLLNRPEG
ncbi:hypothetical protein ABT023_03375 [Micromonospora sp. NPDC002296]|uniref:hypothetical protein n=1 Tax=Micromonospora sp. NPDC002296 TaxID=3154271 RepID=UPI003328F874